MSFNQSRGDKNEPTQYKRSGRSVNPAWQRNFSGGGGKGGGGGSTTAPPLSPSGRSLKVGNNAQGVQPRVNSPNTNLNSDSLNSSAGRSTVQNGAHLQPPVRGAPNAPVTVATVKSTDVSTQKSTPGLPKAPQGNAVTPSSDATGHATPAKGSSDASRAFPLQFGSINPGFMNGMQIPARTNSAPPNMDEQKQAQARLDSLKGTTARTSAAPKQQLQRKDAAAVDQYNANEAYPIPKAKKNVQTSAAPPTTQTQKPSGHPMPGVSMQQLSFHQSQLHTQFGGSNPQIQSQGMANSSLPMPLPIPLPMGNPHQVQQQQPVFLPGMQHHSMQSQGIIHQGQGLNFSSQMGPPQLPSQMGNMGIGVGPQYPQQQTGKFGGPRKTVKITHPDTHEELRLDKRTDGYADGGSSGPRSHPHGPPQSQAIPSFPLGHPMNYYSNSYNGNPLFFPPPNSNPMTNAQITPGSQAPRFYNQVTVKPAVSAHGEKAGGSSLPGSSTAIEKGEFPKIPRARGEGTSIHSQRDSETISGSSLQQSTSPPISMASKPSAATFGSFQSENLTTNSSASPASVADSASLVSSGAEVAKTETISKFGSFKEEQKKAGKKVQPIPLDQMPGQHVPLDSGVPETVKSLTPSSGTNEGVLETSKKVLPGADTVDVRGSSASKSGSGDEGLKSIEIGTETNSDSSLKVDGPKAEIVGSKEQGGDVMTEGYKQHEVTTSSLNAVDRNKDNAVAEVTTTSDKTESLDTAKSVINDTGSSDTAYVQQEEPVDNRGGKLLTSSSTAELEVLNAETSSLNLGSSHGDKISSSDDSVSRLDSKNADNVDTRESVLLDQELPPVSVSVPEAQPSSVEGEGTMSESTGLNSPTTSSSMDKALLETSKTKGSTTKGKKKRKEILKNADAQGTTSDLYMAYKGPDEKKETQSAEIIRSSSGTTSTQASVDSSEKDVASDEKCGHSKFEPDDWEDAADISTPKLETSDNGKQVCVGSKHHSEEGNDGTTKKYSRDFLLKFSEQYTDLPEGFEIPSDIAEAMIVSKFDVSRESYPSPGRPVDRLAMGSRLDRRPIHLGDDDKWSKIPGPLGPGRDMRLDIGYHGNVGGFRPGQGGNYSVLRNPRAQTPVQYAGGILSGPMQSPGAPGSIQRNNSDSDRWQRATGYQKGLIPSPQTPMQVMHKAERKYEVGKATDEEQAKQRQLKGILNKLTPQNFEKLFEQVKQVNIDNAETLSGVIAQIFDKALMEPTFCEMYANFCSRLAVELPDFSEDNEKITFKRLLLNKCQEEFERGEREQEEANRTEEEGEVKQSEEEREEKRVKARRRMLGNIRLIGELYKKKMLTERIMHECIKKLLGQYPNPDEEDIEALCKLMSTIGEMIDHPKAKEHMDVYFDMMSKLSNNMKLSSRVRFMLKDVIDLRKNRWQQRRKVEGPKKIEEVHRDAAQERQAQSSRLGRGPNLNSSLRRGQPMDFGPRGSNVLPSPNAQMGGFRGLPQQLRGYGNQDTRFEDRQSFENRTLSIPLRPIGDDSLTLGPQGGLARGMSVRGQSSMQSMPLPEMPSPADSRRVAAGPNGYGSTSERTGYGPREDFIPRYTSERFAPPPSYDQLNIQERSMNRDTKNAERSFDRVLPSSPPARARVPMPPQNASSDKVWPEERLRDMSMEAIKEFYSARDEKEVALCIKDLNAPSYYPSMISIWVTDSFERKDMERDSLTKLLINLTKPQHGMLTQDALVKGFESVLATLEDAVNDAPRAAEFLGRMFAKILLENVIPYKEVWHLIYEGGEGQGHLVEIGLAAEVLVVILEIIKSEKGDPFLKEMCAGSDLHVQKFRPLNTKKSLRLDKFI